MVIFRICAATVAITTLTGCIGFTTVNSGGPHVGLSWLGSSDPPAEPDFNSFRLTYENWLGFNRDMTVSVDNAFSLVRAGDQNATRLATSFVRPGYEVLAYNYGIRLPSSTPMAKPEEQRFTFETGLSDWTMENDRGDAPIRSALLNPNDNAQARWRGRILDSHIEFNSMQPKRLNIHFELEVQVQARSSRDAEWKYTMLDQRKIAAIAASMRQDLITRYRDYFRNDLDIDVTSPAFRGFHEEN
jgi:hypothetical protein